MDEISKIDLPNAEWLLEFKRTLFRQRLSMNRPFPVSGDVLFVRSGGKIGKNNINYQHIRRLKLPNKLFRFTHVGIVISNGVVAHSLATIGDLEKKIMESLNVEDKKYRRHGVTIDSLSSSGFFDAKSQDFIAFRNVNVFNNIDLQDRIIEKALYLFGLKYNYAIDLKEKLFDEEYAKLRLHCSEFVQQIISATEIANCHVESSIALPVDIYRTLLHDDNWVDVTAEYISDDFDLGDEINAETILTTQMLLQRFRSRQHQASLRVSKMMDKVHELIDSVKRNPEYYSKEINDLLSDRPFKEQVKDCYRGLTDKSIPITTVHIVDEITVKNFETVQKSRKSFAKELYSHYVTFAFIGLISTAELMGNVSDSKSLNSDLALYIYKKINLNPWREI